MDDQLPEIERIRVAEIRPDDRIIVTLPPGVGLDGGEVNRVLKTLSKILNVRPSAIVILQGGMELSIQRRGTHHG